MVREKEQIRNKIIMLCIVGLLGITAVIYSYFFQNITINENHSKPMVVFKDKDKLWQVITYKGKAVTSMVITLYPKFKQVQKKVYLNYRSQFVFSDATPLLLDSEPLFWNRDGKVVTINGKVIDEGLIFLVDNKEVTRGTPLTLFELKVGVLSSIEKQRVMDEAIDPERTIRTENLGSAL